MTPRQEMDTMADIRVIELQSLDLKGSRALMVPLPAGEGRVRVAFVPVKDDWLLSRAGQRSLTKQLLLRLP